VAMFNEVHTPVLGVIENMSYYVCRKCGHRHEIFGHGGGARMAAELNLPLLGELPIAPELRAGGDSARPLVAVSPENPTSREFKAIAGRLLERMARLPKPVAAEIIQ
jgi:ATP-binding protein involved in chromosome partitioning